MPYSSENTGWVGVWNRPIDVFSRYPLEIDGCVLWLDAKDPATITEDVGVSQWDDKSGYENHAVQGNGANQPVYSPYQYLTFDGAASFMNTKSLVDTLNGACTVFFVCSYDDTAPALGHTLANSQGAATSQYFRFYIDNVSGQLYADVSSAYAVTIDEGISDGVNRIWSCQKNSSNVISHFSLNNGTPKADPTSGALNLADTTTIGALTYDSSALQFWDGNISEIIIYDSVLTASQRTSVYQYLSNKWGITI